MEIYTDTMPMQIPTMIGLVLFCLPTAHFYPWTHVAGFTTTYNDFDYTGAVFRLEQSWSTNEPRNFSVRNSMAQAQENGEFQDGIGNPCPTGVTTCPGARAIRGKSKSGIAVWRSMIGFDLLRTWSFCRERSGKINGSSPGSIS